MRARPFADKASFERPAASRIALYFITPAPRAPLCKELAGALDGARTVGQNACDGLIAAKSVKHGQLTVTATGEDLPV